MLRRLMMASTSAPLDPIAFSIYTKVTSWWEMDEVSGSRMDSKGTNHSTIAGTVSTAAGVRGTDVAAAFAGAGGLDCGSADSLDTPTGGGDHCIFGWAYVNLTSGNQALASKWDSLTPTSLDYQVDVQNNSTARGVNGGSAYAIAATTRPSAATWHFYVMWRDSTGADAGKVRLQVDDGTIAMSAAASNPGAGGRNSPLAFGQVGHTAHQRLTGRLQRWGWIQGAILTPEERTWLFNEGTGRTWAEIVALAGT